jgi:twitching motility two-component system response regulator PilH
MTRKAKRILIVEDHKDSSLWISMVLRQCGYLTAEAGDGAMGIQLARKERPDLILLDIHLPAGSGYFVLESLRKFEETRHIPVIIMTGDWELSHAEIRELGAAALFRKPMDVQAFVKTIGQVLENYAATAQLSLQA